MIRPQSNAFRDRIDLSGVWRVRFDPDDVGEASAWSVGIGEGFAIAVPGSWNEQLAEAGFMNYVGAAWLETEVFVPVGYEGRRIDLRFGSADYEARVWADGVYLGASGPAMLPFELDATAAARPGQTLRIVVRVSNALPVDGPTQRVTRQDYVDERRIRDEYLPTVRFDFFPYGGLNRPVHLTATPRTRIEAIRATTGLKGGHGTLKIGADLSGGAGLVATVSGHGQAARATLVVRASYGCGLARPDFDDARNSQAVRFDPTDAANTRELEAGNPFLDPLIADQFDASVAWYPSSQSVFQVAVFHKEITDFFLDFETTNIAQTPIILPTGVSSNFDTIETVINGGEASVTGVELSYSQTFVELPGVLSGLFVEANLTLAESEAETSERPGESFPFPGQADVSGNLSIGWENDLFSMRVAGNHRGEVLSGLSGNGIEDRYRAPFTQIDVNLRWNVTEEVQFYVDGVNLTGEKDVRYYVGGAQNLFERVQDFGSTYQVGVRATF